jgi:hypothetical protein
MGSALEAKKLQVELMRVAAARAEMEFKIMERLEDIERLKEQIKLQEAKEQELKQKIELMEV